MTRLEEVILTGNITGYPYDETAVK